MQFLAGVMLSCGGLLNIVITGGSPGLTASNPGIVKILGGFVFPVGLVMSMNSTFKYVSSSQMRIYRIVLMGLELLTSNMMVRLDCRSFFTPIDQPSHLQGFPDGRLQKSHPMVESPTQLACW